MKHRIAQLAALLVACAATSCGSIGADGGQSGTGISAVRGNVVAAAGTNLDVAGIRVILTEPGLETDTDTAGHFELQGKASGPSELRFERARDGLSASTEVVVPAGGVLELADIALDPESAQAHPSLRRVEFEGAVEALDCAGGTIQVTAKEDEAGTVFTVETASATIRHNDTVLQCSDLRVGDLVEIDAETPDGVTLVNADVVLEDRQDQPEDQNPGDDGDTQKGGMDEPNGNNGNDGMDEPNGNNGNDGMDEPNGNNGNDGVDEPHGDEGHGVDGPGGGNGQVSQKRG